MLYILKLDHTQSASDSGNFSHLASRIYVISENSIHDQNSKDVTYIPWQTLRVPLVRDIKDTRILLWPWHTPAAMPLGVFSVARRLSL